MNKQMKKVLCTALTGAMLLGNTMPAMAVTIGPETGYTKEHMLSQQEMSQAQPRSMGIDYHDGTWKVHEMKDYEEQYLDTELRTYAGRYKRTLDRWMYTEENGKPAEYIEAGRKDFPLDLGNVIIHDVQFLYTEAGYETEYRSIYAVKYEPKVATAKGEDGYLYSDITLGGLSLAGAAEPITMSNPGHYMPHMEHLSGELTTVASGASYTSMPKVGESRWCVAGIYHNGGEEATPVFFVADKGDFGIIYKGLPEEHRYQVKGFMFHDEDVSYQNLGKEEVLVEVPTTPDAVEKSSGFSINVNGATITLGTKLPYIEEGTTMVPVRIISEALGLNVAWDGDKQLVTLTNADNEQVALVIGQNFLTSTFADKGEIELLQPAVIVNGSTYLPLRAISEALGCEVNYESVEGTNVISILS